MVSGTSGGIVVGLFWAVDDGFLYVVCLSVRLLVISLIVVCVGFCGIPMWLWFGLIVLLLRAVISFGVLTCVFCLF